MVMGYRNSQNLLGAGPMVKQALVSQAAADVEESAMDTIVSKMTKQLAEVIHVCVWVWVCVYIYIWTRLCPR